LKNTRWHRKDPSDEEEHHRCICRSKTWKKGCRKFVPIWDDQVT
jgi:hypothetical protein